MTQDGLNIDQRDIILDQDGRRKVTDRMEAERFDIGQPAETRHPFLTGNVWNACIRIGKNPFR